MEKLNKLYLIQKRFKKISKVVLLVFLAAFIIIIFLKIKSNSNKPSNQITETVPKPIITSTFQSTPTLKLELNTTPQLPESLPLVMINKSNLSTMENSSIAKNLGFNEAPKITRDVRYGDIYIWKNNKYGLTVNPKLSQYHLSSFTNLNNVTPFQGLEEKKYLEISDEFLSKLQPLNTGGLIIDKIQYLLISKITGGFSLSNKDDYIIFEITFKLGSLDYNVVDQTSPGTAGYLRLLKNGDVYEFFTTNISTVKILEEKHKVKNLKEIEENLDKASIVAVGGFYGAVSDLPKGDVDAISINSIEIVYLIDNNKQNTYQPVYLMKGKGYSKMLKKEVFPTLYLPAFIE
jgi:hypothetical protein